MEDLFASYYKPKTKAELEELFGEAQIVLDTNVLISLFGFHTATSEDWLKVLTSLKDRLWLPHQVAKEYQSQIEGIVQLHAELKVSSYSDKLEKFKLAKFLSGRENFKDSLVDDGSIKRIDSILSSCDELLVSKLVEVQEIIASEKERLSSEAHHLKIELASLFSGRVGDAFTNDELIRANEIAEARYKHKIPPGHADKKGSFGDAFLWLQTLEYAKSIAPKPLILVTNDSTKGDWFLLDKEGKVKGPLPELVAEMKKIANIDFHLYRPGLFLAEAKKLLKELEIKQESVKETKRYNSYVVPPELSGELPGDALRRILGPMGEINKSVLFPAWSANYIKEYPIPKNIFPADIAKSIMEANKAAKSLGSWGTTYSDMQAAINSMQAYKEILEANRAIIDMARIQNQIGNYIVNNKPDATDENDEKTDDTDDEDLT